MSVVIYSDYYQAFDMSLTKNRWTVPTLGADTFTVFGQAITVWSSGTINVYRSFNGVTKYDQEVAMQLSGATASDQTDCSGFPFLVFEVGTTESVFVNIRVNLSRSVDS